jgi:hypothetical protein
VASLEKAFSSTDGQHYDGILFSSHVNLELIEVSQLLAGPRTLCDVKMMLMKFLLVSSAELVDKH